MLQQSLPAVRGHGALVVIVVVVLAASLVPATPQAFANIQTVPNFREARAFGPGAAPTEVVATGDLDGDGDPDIVAGNSGQPSAVYLNDGSGHFAATPHALIGAGSSTSSIALGDLDADGDLDAVIATIGQPNTVHFNDGTGRFPVGGFLGTGGSAVQLPPDDAAASDNSFDVALGDLNGDGSLDIAVANFGGGNLNKLYFNDGTGRFGPAQPYGLALAIGSVSTSVKLGDLDNDGDLDIVNGNGALLPGTVLLNNAGRFFFGFAVAPSSCPLAPGLICFARQGGDTSDTTRRIDLGDLNGDGWLDIVSGNFRDNTLYLNGGPGSGGEPGLKLAQPSEFGNAGEQTSDVRLGDLDGDGDLDIVTASGRSAPVRIYLNNGAGAVTGSYNADTLPATINGLAVADVNADGGLDLVLANSGQQSAVLLNDGTRTLAPLTVVGLSGGATYAVASDDFDGDGRFDAVYGNVGELNQIAFGNGDGTFREVRSFGTGRERVTSVALADFDARNGPDILVANSAGQSVIYYNDGAGHFHNGPVVCNSTPGVQCLGRGNQQSRAALADDIDQDGDSDVLLGGWGHGWLWLNRGDGSFDLAISFGFSDSTITGLATADVNRDGFRDILTGESGLVNVHLNDGAMNFPFNRRRSVGLGTGITTFVKTADFTGDGWVDLLVMSESVVNLILVNQSGTFSSFVGTTLSSNNRAVMAGEPGDIDNDGDIDVVQVSPDQIRVHRNDGLNSNGFLAMTPVDLPPLVPARGRGLSLSDMNDDGRLDLLVGQFGPQNQLYLNPGGGAFGPARSFGPPGEMIAAVALGDLDGDGDLDLAAGALGAPSAVYLNDGTGRFPQRNEYGRATNTLAVALGDLDGDRDLDLVTANNGSPPFIALNDGAAVFTTTPLSDQAGAGRQVALGDLDGDNDLDVVVALDGGPNTIYRNDGRASFVADGFVGTGNDATQTLALGDLDGDGDLDAAVGNNLGEPSLVYLNDGLGRFSPGPTFTRDPVNYLAVAPLDGDTALDLVVAHAGVPSAVYLNRGAESFERRTLPVDLASFPSSVAVGDLNGDRILDVLVSNPSQASDLLLNDGKGHFRLAGAFGDLDHPTNRLAIGDLDGDGDEDVAAADVYQAISVAFNGRQGAPRSGNSLPVVTIAHPGVTRPAAFFADPGRLVTRIIPITFRLSDADGDRVRRVRAWYSLDGGGSWRPAEASADTVLTNLAAPPKGAAYVFAWDTFPALGDSGSSFFGQSDQVVFRIEVEPDLRPGLNAVAGPYQRPSVSATTLPFRVRGTQVRVVDGDNRPVSGAMVYRLPAGQSSGATLLADTTGAPFRTDPQGYLAGRSTLKIGPMGDQLVALYPVVVTDTYTLYHTSAPVTEQSLVLAPLSASGVQTLTVSPERPLMLFDLDVALEWDARGDPQFLARLTDDLRRTSSILYDWTDGQVALGQVTIFHDARRVRHEGGWDLWAYANVRVYATNRLRPNANKGGVVAEPRADPTVAGVEYEPGQIRIGAVWNRYGEASGSLGEDWPRTLAHELGHYLFALDENYLGLNQHGILVPVTGCRGGMADPYRDDYSEFHPRDGEWLERCRNTLSEQVNGRSDWESILAFYPTAGLRAPSVFNANSGPNLLPLAVTTVAEAPVVTPTNTLDVPIISLEANGIAVQPGPEARAFLFRGDIVTDLGRPVLDRVEARGAAPGDRLCVFEPAATRLGCETLAAGDQTLALTTYPAWQPELTITPVTSRTLTVAVTNLPVGLPVTARLYPADYPAGAPLALSYADGTYSGTFELAEPVFEGLIHLQMADGSGREAVVDFAVGGNPGKRWSRTAPRGNPGKRWSRTAPRGNPGKRWSRTAPVISSDGQVILYTDQELNAGEFYSLQTVNVLPDAPAWATPVGQAYRLTTTANVPTFGNASISFSYLQREVPEGQEPELKIYYFSGTVWEALPTILSEAVNTASAPLRGPGIYALMTSIEVNLRNAGWNLVRYPVRDEHPRPVAAALAGLLNRLSPNEHLIVYEDRGAGAQPRWWLYATGVPTYVNTLEGLTFDREYYIWVPGPGTLPIRGTASLAGPIPQPPSTFYGPVQGNGTFTPAPGMAVTARVGTTVCGQGSTRLVSGQIVYHVTIEAAGTLAGCGSSGDLVTFEVVGQSVVTTGIWNDSVVQELPLRIGPASGNQTLYLPLVQW